MATNIKDKCYCGRNNSFSECCKIIQDNIDLAINAEDLMRSRYSAFVISNGDYLMKSHHSSTRPTADQKDIENWSKSVEWSHLEIIETKNGLENDTEGSVEFNAFFIEKGKKECIHENSKFIRENNHWVYLGFV